MRSRGPREGKAASCSIRLGWRSPAVRAVPRWPGWLRGWVASARSAGSKPPPSARHWLTHEWVLIFAAMSWLPRPSSPRAAFRDFAAFIRHREREHVIGAALALLVTIIIVIEFLVDSKINTAPPPRVVE